MLAEYLIYSADRADKHTEADLDELELGAAKFQAECVWRRQRAV